MTKNLLVPRAPAKAVAVVPVTADAFKAWGKLQPVQTVQWMKTHDFTAKAGSCCLIPDAKGALSMVVVGMSDPTSLWDLAALPKKLPTGHYRLDWDGEVPEQEWLALGWLLGAYGYTRYKKAAAVEAKLSIHPKADLAKVQAYAEAITLARDLINTTAEDLGPQELAEAVVTTGKKFGAKVMQIVGDALLKKNYPAIHTVGRASSRVPRLVDLTWGNPKHPLVTLVGKGVCFDTGGLDLKPSSAMYTMKKDMGGAAAALGVAHLIMSRKLPVRLRLLIPAVENSVSGNAFRPSDIIRMRNGMTVEVGNTDAEGRLILADALSEAATDKPAIIIDFSTLTGAARSAVGTEISAMFANDDSLADNLVAAGNAMEDPMWRMPLYAPYERMLDSAIADINSCPNSPYAGAITAALFLQRFVAKTQRWVHLDFMAWNPSPRAGRPEGGEAMTVRAVYRMIEKMFSAK